MRRTNPHDKNPIAHIEAQEEAARLRESINSIDDDEDEDENFVVLDAITVPQPSDVMLFVVFFFVIEVYLLIYTAFMNVACCMITIIFTNVLVSVDYTIKSR